MRGNPAGFFLVPDCFKTEEMCNDGVDVNPQQLYDVPDYLKTQNMYDEVVQGLIFSTVGWSLHVPDWFITQEQLEIWHDDEWY